MIIANKIKPGDTIGVVAPSNPIIGDNIEELKKAKEILEKDGFKVIFSKNIFSNTNRYTATAKEKAEDINEMFKNKEVKMIWCAKGGNNSNSVFEYLDYEAIKENPKIICGYSDITSITNMITEKTGLVTFSGTNFKTIATDENEKNTRLENAKTKLKGTEIENIENLDSKLSITSDKFKEEKENMIYYYKLSTQDLEDMGIENVKSDEKNGEYIIKYDIKNIEIEIYNTQGFKNEDKYYYSLSELESLEL